MEARDRLGNLVTLVAAGIAWILVGLVVFTRDPFLDPLAGYVGAAVIGLAVGLTTIPLFWLLVFARHRRIAYQGDWTRAIRRGAWVALVVALLVVFRIQGIVQLPIVAFVVALVVVAEARLSGGR